MERTSIIKCTAISTFQSNTWLNEYEYGIIILISTSKLIHILSKCIRSNSICIIQLFPSPFSYSFINQSNKQLTKYITVQITKLLFTLEDRPNGHILLCQTLFIILLRHIGRRGRNPTHYSQQPTKFQRTYMIAFFTSQRGKSVWGIIGQ